MLVLFKKSSQLGEQAVRVRVLDGFKALKGHEDFILLSVAQDGLIQGVAVHEGDTAVFSHVGVNGDAANAQAVNVPVNGADRDLKMACQLAGGHLPLVQKQVDNFEQAMGLHDVSPIKMDGRSAVRFVFYTLGASSMFSRILSRSSFVRSVLSSR